MTPEQEQALGAAIMVVTAFRLRDEDALILTLRKLEQCVDAIEDQPMTTPLERAAPQMLEALKHYARDYDHDAGCSVWDGGAIARAAIAAAEGKSK